VKGEASHNIWSEKIQRLFPSTSVSSQKSAKNGQTEHFQSKLKSDLETLLYWHAPPVLNGFLRFLGFLVRKETPY